MVSKKLVATLAVVAASAVVPAGATAATPAAAPERAAAPAPGTQVGSEGVRAQPGPDGIIAILIGLR